MKKYILLLLCIIIGIMLSYLKYSNESPANGTNICCKNSYVLYNNINGDIFRKIIGNKNSERMIKDRKIISIGDYILCTKNDLVELYTFDGILYKSFSLKDKIFYGEVYSGVLYYIKKDNHITPSPMMMYNIETGESHYLNDICTNSFSIDNGYIYYEHNKDSIYKYSVLTKINQFVLSKKYPFHFKVDDGTIYLSDYNNQNKLSIIDKDGREKITRIKSVKFDVCNGFISYIDYVSEGIPRRRYNQQLHIEPINWHFDKL